MDAERALESIETGAGVADMVRSALPFLMDEEVKDLINAMPKQDSCCLRCEDTHRMVTEIYEGISKIAPMMASLGQNPMAKVMARNMGIDLDKLNGNL